MHSLHDSQCTFSEEAMKAKPLYYLQVKLIHFFKKFQILYFNNMNQLFISSQLILINKSMIVRNALCNNFYCRVRCEQKAS